MLQILSDVHLELLNKPPVVNRNAPYLALLGDIGHPFSEIYRVFVRQMAQQFERVIIIAGNHEYYNNAKEQYTHEDIDTQIRYITQSYNNVTFLQNESFLLDGVRIIGTTLWTHIPEEKFDYVQYAMGDYSKCFVASNGGRFTPAATSMWHDIAVSYISKQLVLYPSLPTVILSHHCPIADVEVHPPRYRDDQLRCCYATNLTHLLKFPVVAWAYGHTHWPFDQEIQGVRVVTNPEGHAEEAHYCGGSQKNVIIKLSR
jgi:predicted phosphodiesterase